VDEVTLGLIIIVLGCVLPSVILGYLIAVKQKRGLIAGWDESKISNPQAYARMIGYSLFALGFLISIVSVLWFLGLVDEIVFTIGLLLASLVPIPFFVLANKKYKLHVS
jgi:hypothetical protein